MDNHKTEGKKNAVMADNQVAFRKLNGKLKKLMDELNAISVERGGHPHSFKNNEVYQFYCECSDENCIQRIELRFDVYEKAHERNDTFTIVNGHELLDVEKIISVSANYCIVQKFETPAQSNTTLHQTALNNVN